MAVIACMIMLAHATLPKHKLNTPWRAQGPINKIHPDATMLALQANKDNQLLLHPAAAFSAGHQVSAHRCLTIAHRHNAPSPCIQVKIYKNSTPG